MLARRGDVPLTVGLLGGFIGAVLGTLMFLNVWLIIWPNQKRALGLVETDDATKAASARTAMLFSRTNTMLSIPMLMSMVSFGHGGFFV